MPVKGGRLYVRLNGDLAGRRAPVVMIHGGPGASHAYLLAALQLADDRPVILYDQLDSGFSDHPGDPANWTVERFTSELDAIRAALDLRRFHVVGHSWGSVIALRHAAHSPAGLRSLTLGSPFISARSWVASVDTQLARLPHAMQIAIRRHDAGELVSDEAHRIAISAFNRQFVNRHAEPVYVTDYRRRTGVKDNDRLCETMFGPGDIRVAGRLGNYDGEHLLRSLKMPTMFLCGQYDEMTPSAVAGLARITPRSFVAAVPDAGHLTSLDAPDYFAACLRRHLRNNDV